MNNIGSSLLILLLAIFLLWFAVTDKMQRLLNAWDALREDDGTVASATPTATSPIAPTVTLKLPSLPTFGTNAQVPV